MKIVFHEKYYNSNYAADPAAAIGRLEGVVDILSKNEEYEFLTPNFAEKEDILRAHTDRHYKYVSRDPLLLDLALLAAGGSILAAEEAVKGNPTFAVIRPPGHHASADNCWGFCYFNNISISLLRLFAEGKINSAFVLDFDLHTGDGNLNILSHRNDGFEVSILNPDSNNRENYINEVNNYMDKLENIDIFVASAGFDQGIEDWGHLLYPEDYEELGRLMRLYSKNLCHGRRYALLEGGYNHSVLPINVDAFTKGFK